METITDNARRYALHQRLVRRWIREGGVVIANGSARAGDRSTFELSETVASGAILQVTFNLREVSKACKSLSDYSVYLWNCDHDGEYILCGLPENGAFNFETAIDASKARAYRRVPVACYAGRLPRMRLDVYDAEVSKPAVQGATIMTRMLLPRGLCAAIYQCSSSAVAAGSIDHADAHRQMSPNSGAMASLRAPFPRIYQTV